VVVSLPGSRDLSVQKAAGPIAYSTGHNKANSIKITIAINFSTKNKQTFQLAVELSL